MIKGVADLSFSRGAFGKQGDWACRTFLEYPLLCCCFVVIIGVGRRHVLRLSESRQRRRSGVCYLLSGHLCIPTLCFNVMMCLPLCVNLATRQSRIVCGDYGSGVSVLIGDDAVIWWLASDRVNGSLVRV